MDPLSYVEQTQPIVHRGRVESFAVITHVQAEPTLLERQRDGDHSAPECFKLL